MNFRTGSPIEDMYKPTRWMVDEFSKDKNLMFLKLHDMDPSIKPPMRRKVTGVCICYENKAKGDEWLVREWREQFLNACKAASGNFAGLPEPIDFIELNNNDSNFPEQLRAYEPLFLYAYGNFALVPSLDPKNINKARGVMPLVTRFFRDLAYILKSLHAKGIVLRQIPLEAIRLMHTSKKYFIGEFMSLCKQGEVRYSPNLPYLNLDPLFSAPECFESGQRLTDATDIYALAKTVLMFLQIRFNAADPFPFDISSMIAEIEDRYQCRLPDDFVRLLKAAFKRNPGERPQNIGEALSMFNGRPYTPPKSKQAPQVQKGTGVVKYYNSDKKFGYILRDDRGDDLYFSHDNIRKNDRVSFEIGRNFKGPCAKNIQVIDRATGAPRRF